MLIVFEISILIFTIKYKISEFKEIPTMKYYDIVKKFF